MDLLSFIKDQKIIAILRGLTCDEAVRTAQCLQNAGIRLIEVPFDASLPQSAAPGIIRTLAETFPLLSIGAGTVLTCRQAEEAYQAGARYIISPNTNPEVIKTTKEYGMLSIPGAFSPTEVVSAYQAGADIVKLFPAGFAGPSYIKALKGPLPHIPIAAVGGITPENIVSFIKAGACCVGIGSDIADVRQIRSNHFEAVEEKARTYRALLEIEGK